MKKKSSLIIGIAANVNKSKSLSLTKEVLAWISKKQHDYRLDSEIAEVLDIEHDSKKVIARKDITSECDIVVVLGGDGTYISVSRHPSEVPAKVIAVNLGTLGFLTEITEEEVINALEATVSEKIATEARYLLEAKVIRQNSEIAKFYAINDVVITKQALARIFSINLSVDHQFAAAIRGDGMIIATPSGSTAYSLAAGGSIVHPSVKGLLITPIAPHSLTVRPLVIPAKAKLGLELGAVGSNKQDNVFLTIDGQEGMALHSSDQIQICTSDHHVLIAKSPSKSYYQVLTSKLRWGSQNV